MAPAARPTSCVLAPVRAADPALDFLPSVLGNIQSLSRMLEQRIVQEDKRIERGVLKRLRSAAYSIHNIFQSPQPAGRHSQLIRYAYDILGAVEGAVDVGSCGEEFKCALWKQSYNRIYPKCHALCHLVSNNSIDPFLLSFASSGLHDRLADIFDELQVEYPIPAEGFAQLEDTKYRRHPQWEISSSACQVFHALSNCRCGMVNCSVSGHSEVHLALATYWNIREGGEHSFDVLFARNTEMLRWDEVRIHRNCLASTSSERSTNLAMKKVNFLEKSDNGPSAARQWWEKKPKRIPHICKLLGEQNAHLYTTHRVNVTLDAGNDIWQHVPTQRIGLSHAVSFANVMASDMSGQGFIAKSLLAVILGYSLFYLYEGPWLGVRNATGWSREKIMFFQSDGKVKLRPFLSSDFRDHAANSTDDGDFFFHPYPVLVEFAITLLEIHLGRTLESFLDITEPLTSGSSKWSSACDAFEKRKPFISGPDYRDAIEACLYPSLWGIEESENEDTDADEDTDEPSGTTRANTDKVKQLRGRIFAKIVGPLHDDLEHVVRNLIDLNNLDEEAATMDLGSGALAQKDYEIMNNHAASHMSSAHDQIAMSSSMSSFRRGKATIVSAIKPVTSEEPIRVETGEVYTLFDDPSVARTISSDKADRTDKWFMKFQSLEVFRALQELKHGDPRRVRMAIIDTGIDMTHMAMQAARLGKRIVTVCDWVNGRGGEEDWDVGDACGHGTHIASVILKMAPNVDLYIARVTEGHELNGSQVMNIADAIRTASLTWKCSSINLSLGFRVDIPSIQDAVEDATRDKKTFVFAAASNDGANSGTAFPACLSIMVGINSTDSYGNPSDFSPTPNAIDGDVFSIIGENIEGAWPSSVSSRNAGSAFKRLSGSSFATPIAAALVACILGVASELETNNVTKLASYEGIRRVLFKMAKKRNKHLCLDPVSFFDREKSRIQADVCEALDMGK